MCTVGRLILHAVFSFHISFRIIKVHHTKLLLKMFRYFWQSYSKLASLCERLIFLRRERIADTLVAVVEYAAVHLAVQRFRPKIAVFEHLNLFIIIYSPKINLGLHM